MVLPFFESPAQQTPFFRVALKQRLGKRKQTGFNRRKENRAE
jgi:hypothetical protein